MSDEKAGLGMDREGVRPTAASLINSKNHRPSFGLDALVDEHVFGHTIAWRNSFAWRADIIDEIKANSRGFDLVTESRSAGAWVPSYSSLIDEAWKVLEYLENDERRILSEITRRMSTFGTHFIYAVVLRQCTAPFPPNWWSEEATAPLAICVAALKAVGA